MGVFDMNSMMEYRHLSDEDLAVLSMVLLTLLDFGYCIPQIGRASCRERV